MFIPYFPSHQVYHCTEYYGYLREGYWDFHKKIPGDMDRPHQAFKAVGKIFCCSYYYLYHICLGIVAELCFFPPILWCVKCFMKSSIRADMIGGELKIVAA